jgi:hypothetical protein
MAEISPAFSSTRAGRALNFLLQFVQPTEIMLDRGQGSPQDTWSILRMPSKCPQNASRDGKKTVEEQYINETTELLVVIGVNA